MINQVQEALPSYEVGGELGRGAMGVVLAAHHRQLDREVAIKQLPPGFAGDAEVRRRFGVEAKTLAALAHPHIVPVYDYVEREGLCLLVMEALPGGTLWELFISEGVTMPTACATVLATCSGLQLAHDRGVLHRDVKPENMMFSEDRTLKVTDFGIAEVFGGGETVTTVDGTVIGTPAYMAPEQALGQPLNPAADVYATGTVLYELLSGTLPFSEEGEPLEVLERRVKEQPVPLSEAGPQVPAPLVAVTMRALHREPAERYDSAEAFGVALGNAATEAFGTGWLGRANVTLLATGSIGAAAGPAITPASAVDDEIVSPIAGRTTGETFVSGSNRTIDSRVGVRETTAHRAGGGALADLRPEDLVRVDDLISPPRTPWLTFAAAALLFVIMLVVAAIGFAEPSRGGAALPAGAVTVDGVDLGTNDSVNVNLSKSIPVTVTDLPEAADAVYAQFGFSAAGVGLGTSRSAPLEPDGDGFTAAVNAERIKIITSGDLTAEFRLLDGEKQTLLGHEFAMDPEAPFFLTATGVAGLLLALFVISYGLSITAPLRRGYARRTAYVGLPILGAVAGVAVTFLAWSLGAGEPSAVTFIVAAALGAASFALLTRATTAEGRRLRVRRAEQRANAPEPEPANAAA
jgi:serine/threonine-protein kinase